MNLSKEIMDYIRIKGHVEYNLKYNDIKLLQIKRIINKIKGDDKEVYDVLAWLTFFKFTKTKLYKELNKKSLPDLYCKQILYN